MSAELGDSELTHNMTETEVDGREWAVRHLSTALNADRLDETDYHVSLAIQLLAGEAAEGRHPEPDAGRELNAQNR